MNDKEQRIKEQRLIEATRKGLMGLAGKLACIARNLGSKIISETPEFYSSTPLFDVWGLQNDDQFVIQDPSEDGGYRELGWVFDGLSRAMHLEIKYMYSDKSLTVYHKGYTVYREVSGDLECYAPTREWEDMVDKLFVVAKRVADSHKKEEAMEAKERNKSFIENKIEQLRLRWGI